MKRQLKQISIKIYVKLKKLWRGFPLVIIGKNKVYKFSIIPSTVKNLTREVHNTSLATNWMFYSERVVNVQSLTAFIVQSNRIVPPGNKTPQERYREKQRRMINLSMKNISDTLNAERKPASSIIKRELQNLDISLDLNHPVHKQFNTLLQSAYFDFPIPSTPMHGDFIPMNALLKKEKLWLIDWEYACPDGSIIFDWWFLKVAIERNGVLDEKTDKYLAFLDKSLRKLEITDEQFDAFGGMMHTVINMARVDDRKSPEFEKHHNKVWMIVNPEEN